eukprot:g13442.t1
MSSSGLSAPSEPSETEPLLMDDKNKSLLQSTLFHVSFPKPPVEVCELNDGWPPVEYRLEAQFGRDVDESDWRSMDRALMISDPDASVVTALVPMMDEDREQEFNFEFAQLESRESFARKLPPLEVRFRLAAERLGSDILRFDAVHSKPSHTFSQDLPEMPSNIHILGVSGEMLCILFQWATLARSCKGRAGAGLAGEREPEEKSWYTWSH